MTNRRVGLRGDGMTFRTPRTPVPRADLAVGQPVSVDAHARQRVRNPRASLDLLAGRRDSLQALAHPVLAFRLRLAGIRPGIKEDVAQQMRDILEEVVTRNGRGLKGNGRRIGHAFRSALSLINGEESLTDRALVAPVPRRPECARDGLSRKQSRESTTEIFRVRGTFVAIDLIAAHANRGGQTQHCIG